MGSQRVRQWDLKDTANRSEGMLISDKFSHRTCKETFTRMDPAVWGSWGAGSNVGEYHWGWMGKCGGSTDWQPLQELGTPDRMYPEQYVLVAVVLLAAQLCLTLWDLVDPARLLLCRWDSPGKNTGVDRHSLLQKIFPTQGSNPGLLHCRQILYCLSYREDPKQHGWSEKINSQNESRAQYIYIKQKYRC